MSQEYAPPGGKSVGAALASLYDPEAARTYRSAMQTLMRHVIDPASYVGGGEKSDYLDRVHSLQGESGNLDSTAGLIANMLDIYGVSSNFLQYNPLDDEEKKKRYGWLPLREI